MLISAAWLNTIYLITMGPPGFFLLMFKLGRISLKPAAVTDSVNTAVAPPGQETQLPPGGLMA